jgi:hypothetical protein
MTFGWQQIQDKRVYWSVEKTIKGLKLDQNIQIVDNVQICVTKDICLNNAGKLKYTFQECAEKSAP